MIIILERIPEKTRESEVEDFFSTVVKGKIYQKSGKIEQIKISILNDNKKHLLVFYALVIIDSDEAAARVIKRLNRKVFNGKRISVREYYLRSWRNDRRTQKQDGQLVSKRKGDRRLLNLKVRKSSIVSYSSLESFHRKF